MKLNYHCLQNAHWLGDLCASFAHFAVKSFNRQDRKESRKERRETTSHGLFFRTCD